MEGEGIHEIMHYLGNEFLSTDLYADDIGQ